MASKYAVLFLAATAAVAGAAHAAGRPATVGDLQEVQAGIIMMRARNVLAEETAKMEQRAAPQPGSANHAQPIVVRVTGASDRPTAFLLMADGSMVTAKAGATVAGGFRITEVSARQVLATRAGETVSLGFARPLPAQPQGAAYMGGRQP